MSACRLDYMIASSGRPNKTRRGKKKKEQAKIRQRPSKKKKLNRFSFSARVSLFFHLPGREKKRNAGLMRLWPIRESCNCTSHLALRAYLPPSLSIVFWESTSFTRCPNIHFSKSVGFLLSKKLNLLSWYPPVYLAHSVACLQSSVIIMTVLKDLVNLRKHIAGRLRQALEELQENLALGKRQRIPIPVAVPTPRGYRSGFSRMAAHQPRLGFHSTRFYSSYCRTNFGNMRWNNINGSMMFHNFSSRSQFRSRLFANFYKGPTLLQLLKQKDQVWEREKLSRTRLPRNDLVAAVAMSLVPLALRLNLLLTLRFHDVVMGLARSASTTTSEGCYVDFQLSPTMAIPSATIMSAEVLAELLVSLKLYEKQIVALQRDLTRLSELGELPVRMVDGAIRVYFPNCDREKVEALLLEKNVCGGMIFEDVLAECSQFDSDEMSTVSDFDVLSSCGLLSLVSSASDDVDDDVLSSLESGPVVHLEPVLTLDRVNIVDEYYWA